jgi:hypothetical protein
MNIIKLLKQAGNGKVRSPGDCHMLYPDELKRFARLVRQQALEEAEVVALAEPRVWAQDAPDPQHRIAAAIRQLKDVQ